MGLLNCLMNVPEAGSLVGPVKCGNQIVEMGEECDCGSVDDCTRSFTIILKVSTVLLRVRSHQAKSVFLLKKFRISVFLLKIFRISVFFSLNA